MSIGDNNAHKTRTRYTRNYLNLSDDNLQVLNLPQQNPVKVESKTSPNIHFEPSEIGKEPNPLNTDPKLSLDMIPRKHNRYGTVENSFNFNGIKIPEDAIVVAVRDEHKSKRPKEKNFKRFRVYNSDGALLTKFHRSDIRNKNKLKRA